MRSWHEAAAGLAARLRPIDVTMLSRETQTFLSKEEAVRKAIKKAGHRGLSFDDFESEFDAFEDRVEGDR